jgi:hypothetical protein
MWHCQQWIDCSREAAKIVRGGEGIELFEDQVYKSSNLFHISTSQVTENYCQLMSIFQKNEKKFPRHNSSEIHSNHRNCVCCGLIVLV